MCHYFLIPNLIGLFKPDVRHLAFSQKQFLDYELSFLICLVFVPGVCEIVFKNSYRLLNVFLMVYVK
jgi:hypothetical protein